MKKFKEFNNQKIKRIFFKILPFIFLLLILATIYHGRERDGDDLSFANYSNLSIKQIAISRYFGWSSRIIIEEVLIFFSNPTINLKFFKIINILMFVILVLSISNIFIKDNKKILNWVLVFGILSIPLSTYNNAGMISTTTNYLWTISLGMFACIPIKKIINGEKIKWFQTILYIISIIYATNQELIAGSLFIVYSLYIISRVIYNKKNINSRKKIGKTAIILYIIIILSLIFILTCPGNYVRQQNEIQNCRYNFSRLNIIDKTIIGIISTMKYLVIDEKIIFIIFSALMFIYIFLQERYNLIYKIISIIPFISSIFISLFNNTIINMFPNIEKIISGIQQNELLILYTNKMDSIIIVIIYLIILISILINLFCIFKGTKTKCIIISLYIIGLISRIIMGFSPTVLISGERTMIIMYTIFIILIVKVFNKIIEDCKEKKCLLNLESIYFVIMIIPILNNILA